mgnify:CR=1 FL=1
MAIKELNDVHRIRRINPRTLQYTVSENLIQEVKEDSDIIKLEYKDSKAAISVGNSFNTEKTKYKVNCIKLVSTRTGLRTYNLLVSPNTKTNIFLLPVLGGNRRLLFYESLLVNSFINYNDYEDHLILLYRFSSELNFLKFEQAVKKFRTFVASYDPDKYHVVFVLRIPPKYSKVLNLFKEGKYSEFPEAYKQKILDFHDFDIEGQTAQILYKSEERRNLLEKELNVRIPDDSELYDIPDLKEETLTDKYFIK